MVWKGEGRGGLALKTSQRCPNEYRAMKPCSRAHFLSISPSEWTLSEIFQQRAPMKKRRVLRRRCAVATAAASPQKGDFATMEWTSAPGTTRSRAAS